MRIRRITIDTMVAVVALAQKRTIELAAKELGLTPSAVHKRIQAVSGPIGNRSFRSRSKFVGFSDACKAYRYIGLCYGPPGVGKTLSARRYSRADSWAGYDRWNDATMPSIMLDTVMYTAEVVNTPCLLPTTQSTSKAATSNSSNHTR